MVPIFLGHPVHEPSLPVIRDGEELFETELSHVTLVSDQRVNVNQNVTAIDNTVHLMYGI